MAKKELKKEEMSKATGGVKKLLNRLEVFFKPKKNEENIFFKSKKDRAGVFFTPKQDKPVGFREEIDTDDIHS